MKKLKRFLIMFMVVALFVFVGSRNVYGADFTIYPNTNNVVIELDFNYPETNYIYYSVEDVVFDLDYAMGMFLYNDVEMRYNFINYLFYLKDEYTTGVGSGFVVDIYLPKRRTINDITYYIDWGILSYTAFDTNGPIVLDSVIGSDYIALKFVYNDVPSEFYEYFDMYILDNTGKYYSFIDIFNGLSFARFERGYGESPSQDFNLFVNIVSFDGLSYDAGYDDGYDDAKQYYGHYDGSNYITADEYGLNEFERGKIDGKYIWGILKYGDWYNAEQWGDIQYQHGINANTSENPLSVMFGGLTSLFGVAFAFILQLGSIELMGISLNMILGIGLLLVGILAVLGLIFGGK